jgi:hypothetical protein
MNCPQFFGLAHRLLQLGYQLRYDDLSSSPQSAPGRERQSGSVAMFAHRSQQHGTRRAGNTLPQSLRLLLGSVLMLALVAAMPAAADAQGQFHTWQSEQFGMTLAFPTTWNLTDEQSDPDRGDVAILGNDVSALLVGLLHDTRTPQQMADDLVMTQKEQTPDLAVVQQEVTSTGSVLMFVQYTIHPQSATAMLIDEKALVGTLQAGASTITLRGMVPDQADVAEQFDQIEHIISTLASSSD